MDVACKTVSEREFEGGALAANPLSSNSDLDR